MSRRVILIRHAMPDIPLGERWCVGGRSDFPLGRLGRIQAARLPFTDELCGVQAVFASRLVRAIETARPLGREIRIMPGLEEQDMGVWDGLSFREIMARYPALYAAREDNPSLLPDGAESGEALRARMQEAVLRCVRESEGDIAIVSHKGSIAALAGHRSALGYTSLSFFEEEGGSLRLREAGRAPRPELTDELCLAMLSAAGANAALAAHCRAVAALADELCLDLQSRGVALDAASVHAAALLHDLAKGEKDHAAVGGAWLRELGYVSEAEIVRQHTDPDSAELNEAALVFLADKAVRGSERVSLDERFAASLEKCKTAEARAAHARREKTARKLKEEINRLCGAERI